MCIAVIKKVYQNPYKYIIAFNRDEKMGNLYKMWGYHWREYKQIWGCYDCKSDGSWFAINENNVLAFILNRESNFEMVSKSRGKIVLEVLVESKTAEDAIDAFMRIDTNGMNPFNLMIADLSHVIYCFYQNNVKDFYEIDNDLILINRSFPNDCNETRIRNNFDMFEQLETQYTNNLKCRKKWNDLLKKSCYCINKSEEKSMSLISKEWRTLSSTVVVVHEKKENNRYYTLFGDGL